MFSTTHDAILLTVATLFAIIGVLQSLETFVNRRQGYDDFDAGGLAIGLTLAAILVIIAISI